MDIKRLEHEADLSSNAEVKPKGLNSIGKGINDKQSLLTFV
jgi:hypothetical protein